MKKRFITILLVVTMIMSMVVVPVSAVTTVTQKGETCPHCDTPWDDCGWKEWVIEDPNQTVPSGHYYLTQDQIIKTRYKIGTSDGQTQEYAVDVCLDLRGFRVEQTTSDRRAFYVYNYSTFSIMDTVGGGKIIGTGATGSNGNGGTLYACENANINLYGGTLTYAGPAKEKKGGVLHLKSDSTFNMTGGIIDASMITEAPGVNVKGSAININSYARVDISGGMILGGAANQGGAIAVDTSGQLNISGGTLVGGKADSHGGVIYSLGTVIISGGTITGGISGDEGGNIYSSGTKADLQISGGVIENGQCISGGGNITISGGTGTISGGTISGNMYTSCPITLTGEPIIDHYGYEGLVVNSGTLLTIKDLTQNAKIVVRGDGAITEAATSPDAEAYLSDGRVVPASRYGIAVTDGALVCSLDDTGYCPHCQQEVTWEEYTVNTAGTGHYYIPAGGVIPDENSPATHIAEGVDVVVNLAHGSLKPTVPYTVEGTLSILSTAGSIGRFYNTVAASTNGGTAYVTGTVNVYDGILGGSTTSADGGVLYLDDGKLNMYGGWIEGGSAANGGNIYLNTKNAAMVMDGGVVTGGSVTTNGGNIYSSKSTITVNDGVIMDGFAQNVAGNIFLNSSGKLIMNGGLLLNGDTDGKGGNHYMAGTACETTINNGVIYGGTAGTIGGNLFVNNGRFWMYGGSVINGEADTTSGNIHVNTGASHKNANNYAIIRDNNTADNIPAPMIVGGKATTGGNLYISGDLTLGACTITGGKATSGADVWLGNNSYLTVEPGFTQELVMYLQSGRITQLEQDGALANTTSTELNAVLYAENYNMARLMKTADNALGLAGASLLDINTGEQTWYLDAQAAVNAWTSTEYVKLYAPSSTVVMDKNIVIDINGTNLDVSGTGTLYGFDSGNDDYVGNGVVTATGVTVEPNYSAPNNRQYVTVAGEDGITFHRLGITISEVSLRPSNSGIYFRGTWECDATLQEKILRFGVAVSTADMPKADFAADKDTLYTEFDATSFTNGEPKTSVMVKNILRSDVTNNKERGEQKIFAAPYVVLSSGDSEIVVAAEDANPGAGGVSYSMYDVMRAVNRIWPRLSDQQQTGVKNFYSMDAAVMNAWDLYNITAAVNGTPVNRPLKILTLGHSLALDAGHMMNLVAAAEGYTDMKIATLYYSGCPLYKHVDYLTNNTPAYDLYVSEAATPDKIPVVTKNVTMYDAIVADDWDIIIMQGGVFEIAQDGKYTDGNIQIIQDYVNRHKTNPDAIFAWNMTWVPPTDAELMAKYPNSPNAYITNYEAYNTDRSVMYNAVVGCVGNYIVPDSSFVYMIPTGTAMENAMSTYMTEKDLYRDYVHASDLMRVIASYTWYCTLAGVDHLDDIKLTSIPVAFLRSTSDKTVDRVITEAEKAIIIEAVNNALRNPLQVTQSQYTTAPGA